MKTKGRKRTSTMVSSNPTSHKVEEKKKPGHSGDQNWGRVFREQNKAVMKQEATRVPGSKSSKHGNDTKESKKHFLNHQKLDVSINFYIYMSLNMHKIIRKLI